ncbi:metallophosphoesterase family protein [Halobacteriovorax sp. RZ-1]|uniref:metallophosphoesterase family protein n=1 Tax=unclassified Halobacteriovorax TaxID=2639665 RepID=UPI0037229BBC
MKLTFFSDTHNRHSEVPFESGDILFHTGDFTRRGSLEDTRAFAEFVAGLDFKHKIVIAGNHDFCFDDERKEEAEAILKENGIIYLNDSGIEIEGFKIWGSPIQPWFHDWAFNRHRGPEIQKHWDLIPNDTDILLTHGPPRAVMDLCANGERVGCTDLLKTIQRVQPRVHAYGHIHEGYGTDIFGGIIFVNSCSLDESYNYKNAPITLELS